MTKLKMEGAKDVKRSFVLEALLCSSSISEAAEMAGITRRALYHTLERDVDLMRAFRNIRRGQIRDIVDGLSKSALKAVAVLTQMLDDDATPAAVKVSAASKILETVGSFRMMETEGTKAALVEAADCLLGFDVLGKVESAI